jgi:fibronectin-binding autotransporter adhesin
VLDGNGPQLTAVSSFATDRAVTVRDGFGFVGVDEGKTLTLAGPVKLDGSLAKNGAGVLVLSYAGGGGGGSPAAGTLVVSQGTLLFENAAGPGVAADHVRVNSRATLGGNGHVGPPVFVLGGGILAPGRPGEVGSLTTASLTMDNFSALAFDLAAPGTGDHLQVSGPLVLDGVLRINPLDGFGPGTYRLIDYTGPMLDGTLTVSPFVTDAYRYQIDASVPGQVNLLVTVPEPAGLALLAGFGAAAGLRRRRRF